MTPKFSVRHSQVRTLVLTRLSCSLLLAVLWFNVPSGTEPLDFVKIFLMESFPGSQEPGGDTSLKSVFRHSTPDRESFVEKEYLRFLVITTKLFQNLDSLEKVWVDTCSLDCSQNSCDKFFSFLWQVIQPRLIDTSFSNLW